MISINSVKKYCRDDISLIKNYNLAIADKKQQWYCHHINEMSFTADELKKMNMYYNRPANEFIFLTAKEHKYVHNNLCSTAEKTKRKLSKSLSGKTKIFSDFDRKFYEYYNTTKSENYELYKKEYIFFRRNNKCSWEK